MRSDATRRGLIAALALVISAVILRPQLSNALVIRGDDLAYGGQALKARRMYVRAIVLDPENATAVDRLAFAEIISHRSREVRDAINGTSAYLDRHRSDAIILADRALGFQVLHDYRSAQRDFQLAGRLTRNPQTLTFAGFAALHARDGVDARKSFRAALIIDPSYVPARRGLARSS